MKKNKDYIVHNMKYIFLFIACFGISNLFSQNSTISGKIIFSDGNPAPYANVLLRDTQKGSITDSLGRYTISNVPNGNYYLVASMMGYKSFETLIEVNDKNVEVPVIVLEQDTESLDEIVVEAIAFMKVRRENGKLEVNVSNTNFELAPNAWEGLKQVPMLQVSDNSGIKIFNKNAIVEINGVRTRMAGSQLQDYLKSLDPGAIKKIEMQPNPGAAYGTEVDAYINIILKRGANNYRLGLNTTNGFRTDYFNSSGGNFALNLENFRLYTNYSFSYSPRTFTGSVAQKIGDNPLIQLDYEEENLSRNHNALININFDIGEKNNIDLTQIFSLRDIDVNGLSQNGVLQRLILQDVESRQFQFAQVWKHEFNDSVNLEVGSYQIFQKSEEINAAITNNQAPENQFIEGDIPIIIVFADYVNDNSLGTTSAGLKYNNISVENSNYRIINSERFPAPYQYSEGILAAYIEHSISLSDSKSLRFGLRSESSFIDYGFTAPFGNESFSDSQEYTNFLYNIEYNWSTPGKRFYNLAFRKQVRRPNYSYLNPFQAIDSNIIYSSGDTSLEPAKYYTLSSYTFKGAWLFWGQTGVMKDFISSVYQVEDQAITSTYRNFETVYLAGLGFQYNKSFFDRTWTTKTGGSINFYKLLDDEFEVQEATPSMVINTTNNIKLAKDFTLNVDFEYVPTSRDGLIEHHSSSRFDISLTKKFGDQFTAILFAHDIFQSDRSWNSTTIPGYFYETRLYRDIRSIGLTLRWSLTGKAYKDRTIERPDDEAIDRL